MRSTTINNLTTVAAKCKVNQAKEVVASQMFMMESEPNLTTNTRAKDLEINECNTTR